MIQSTRRSKPLFSNNRLTNQAIPVIVTNSNILVGPSGPPIFLERTSLMTSLIRSSLSSLLCCLIAFGHAPGWLHVATCDGHSHAQVAVSIEKAEPNCSHCCEADGRDGSTFDQDSPPSDNGGGSSQQEHDSDSCLLCHSLASPCGGNWQESSPHSRALASQPVLLSAEAVFTSASLSIANPRGPPAVA